MITSLTRILLATDGSTDATLAPRAAKDLSSRKVHSAKVVDRDGIKLLLEPSLSDRLPCLRHLWLDAGHTGQKRGAGWVESLLGWTAEIVRLPPKPAPRGSDDEVGQGMSQRGRGRRRLAQTVAPEGFVVLPRRWVMERTLSWIDQYRRMSKGCERLCASGEALVYAAMIRIMTRRIARP